ncbi:putative ribonuclease H-like domain-containing protein [Tanacetum coccineum]
MKKMYCLVVIYDYSRFSWVFFLATKDETSGILKSFITRVENLIDQRVKVIRYDNGTEFKNKEMNQFCERKGIKREFSIARTPQQNGVAERKNRTLIEATRTMLADSKLPTTFWAEAVNTTCYVQNKASLMARLMKDSLLGTQSTVKLLEYSTVELGYGGICGRVISLNSRGGCGRVRRIISIQLISTLNSIGRVVGLVSNGVEENVVLLLGRCMAKRLILATLDGLDVGLLGDVIGEDDCDDDG